MVMTHFSSTALSKSSLNIGLQSSLLRSSFLKEKYLEQIRPSQSQWFRNLLSRFYRAQDGFQCSNRISKFQRTKYLYSQSGSGSTENIALRANALYPRPERRGFTAC
jgi:hypothetical protein